MEETQVRFLGWEGSLEKEMAVFLPRNPMDRGAWQATYSPWNFLGQNTEVGSLSLLQGIFPTQESNLGLL